MAQELEDRIGGTWQETIRMGNGPLASLDSAEAQVRWIGLPWERRPIQKQLGAQLLAGGAEGAGQWVHGVLAWTLGSGTHYEKALRYAEPHFDHEAADRIIATIANCDPTRGRDLRLASLAAEAWDLLSEDSLRQLVDSEIPPQLGLASPASESRGSSGRRSRSASPRSGSSVITSWSRSCRQRYSTRSNPPLRDISTAR